MLPAKERANSNFIWSSFQHAQIAHLVLILPGPDLKTMRPAAARSAVSHLAVATSAWLSYWRPDPARCWEHRGFATSLLVPTGVEGSSVPPRTGVPMRVAAGGLRVGVPHRAPRGAGDTQSLRAPRRSLTQHGRNLMGTMEGGRQLIIWQSLLLNNPSKGQGGGWVSSESQPFSLSLFFCFLFFWWC